MTALVTRFAPSPTGELHLGHAFSALTAWERAQKAGGRFLLRIEDIDTARCRPAFMEGIFTDLQWLGLTWEEPVRIQSQHFADYAGALERIKAMGLLYPCSCSRADIAGAQTAPHGPDGPIYPGTCRHKSEAERAAILEGDAPYAWRLDVTRAFALLDRPLSFIDEIRGQVDADPTSLGDVVLARKDTPASYHLCVVHDDALQGITHVVRGEDLFFATPLHVLLQTLLGFPVPTYHHHRLLLDHEGKRFAKRNQSVTLAALRGAGMSAERVREMADPDSQSRHIVQCP